MQTFGELFSFFFSVGNGGEVPMDADVHFTKWRDW